MSITPIKPFQVQIRYKAGMAILDLQGDITIAAEDALDEAYSKAENSTITFILLNFYAVDYINSTGVALIVSLLARARKNHQIILVCGLSAHYVEIFQITSLIDFINMFPDESSALATLKPSYA